MSQATSAAPRKVSFLLLYPGPLASFTNDLIQQLEYCGLKGHVAACELAGASLLKETREAIDRAFHALLLFGPAAAPTEKQLGDAIEIQRRRKDGFHLFPVLVDNAELPSMRRPGAKEFKDRTLRLSSGSLLSSLPSFLDGLIPSWTRANYFARYWLLEELIQSRDFAAATRVARELHEKSRANGREAYDQAMIDVPMSKVLLARALRGSGEIEESLALLRAARDEMLAVLERTSSRAEPSAAVALIEIADVMLDIKMIAEAAVVFEDAAGAATAEGDPLHAAIAKGQLAQIRVAEKRYEDAVSLCGQVRDIFAAMNDRNMLARAWRQLGHVHQQASQWSEAEGAYREALQLDPDPELCTTIAGLCAKQERLRDAAAYSRQAAQLHAGRKETAQEMDSRLAASRYLAKLGAAEEARAEIEAIEQYQATLGDAAQPWKALDARRQLELALGNSAAAAEAKQKALDTFLAFRRKRGENDMPSGEISNFVVFAVAGGATEMAAKQLEQFHQDPNLPANAKAYVAAIREVVAGSRDRSLADHPDLTYDEAAEVHVLIDALS
jgi:tetratricopeptide (TPR) repeat protein